MKQLLIATALALAAAHSFAQTANTSTSSETSSGAQAGSMAIGGGAVNATIGGSTNRNTARGGAGGNGVASSNVTVNLGSTSGDPSSSDPTSRSATPVANAQQGTSQPSGTFKESIQTVGSPGSMSYGVSFSQYNCANTAGVGAGFMGGAFQIGVGKESNPCNARANAAALFSIAQTLATSNQQLSAQLYHAAILLIGNSTSETREALAAAGVSDWAPVPTAAVTPAPAPAIVPPAPPADESKAIPVPHPAIATSPLPESNQQPVAINQPILPPAPVKVEEPVDTTATVSDYQLPPADSATSDQIAEIKAKMFPSK